ncbi:LOW QUALITY PROTEIN: fatty acid synthase-like [Aphomia sociella]
MESKTVNKDRLNCEHLITHIPTGDEICITGISGSFPATDSVKELQENLFNKVDLISGDIGRWDVIHPEIPQRIGKINNLNKFDANFFGIHYKQAHTMEPVARILMEKTYEAIVDAGLNPNELRNTNTGVFIGVGHSESELGLLYDKMHVNSHGFMGCSRAMFANRISHWLGLTGPSYALESACSTSMHVVEHGFKAIRDGLCDAAIVAGVSSLCLHPSILLQQFRLGVLSFDGRCKCFDRNANGYARSEAVVVCFLQKAKDSRRVYTQLLNVKTTCDGYNKRVLCTNAGDNEELTAVVKMFCPGRKKPLMIGSVKSNIGHTETSSGFCSIAKICIAYSTGFIPPNLHYNNPREGFDAFVDGRIKVITEKQPWNRGLVASQNLGFGGANAHALFKNAAREKINNGLPADDLPRLVCASGRNQSAVAKILDDLESRPVDVELVRLFHAIHSKNIDGHFARGFTLLGSTPNMSVRLARDIQYYSGVRRPVWFIYSGLGSQWTGMAMQLMRIPVFAIAISRCHKALESKGINLAEIVTKPNSKNNRNIVSSYIGITAVQIGLTDVLKTVGIEPDHIIGHCFGEMLCAYTEGYFTAEEMILAAYSEGLALTDAQSKKQPVDSIGLTYNKVSVPFEETPSIIQDNAIIVEIAPHGVLQTILQKCLKQDVTYVSLSEKNNEDNVHFLFTALGKLYESGLNPQLDKIYPHVPFPVSRGTPMISHLVEWDHSEDWYVTYYNTQKKVNIGERIVKMSIAGDEYDYMAGYVIDGHNLCAGTGLLILAWETLAMMMGKVFTKQSVVFENVCFQRPTSIPKEDSIEFIIRIHKGTGNFEIDESGTTIVTGRIYAKEDVVRDYHVLPMPPEAVGPNVRYMLTKDFYKELRLRGYQYSGLFCGVIGCNVENTRGRIAWVDNWVTFLDCMLQLKIIGEDTRDLFLPKRIDKLSIDTTVHYNAVSRMNPKYKSFEVRAYHNVNIVRSGGVEICGLHTMPMSKRMPLEIALLEKNVFIPYFDKNVTKLWDCLRASLQLIIENTQAYKVKTIEFIDEAYKEYKLKSIIGKIGEVIDKLPTVQGEFLLVTEENVETPSNNYSKEKLTGESNAVVFIGANLLNRESVLNQAAATLRDRCFIISREKNFPNYKEYSNKYQIISIQNIGTEYVVLLRKRVVVRPANFMKIELRNDDTFSWIEKVQEELKNSDKVVLYSQNEHINGLLGFVNALRKDPGGEIVGAFLISDPTAPKFDPSLKFYKDQLDKDLAINVYQDGQWGSYRHLFIEVPVVKADHAYVNTISNGDLSSLKWVEGPLTKDIVFKDPNSVLVQVYCAAINLLDVMTATGYTSVKEIANDRLSQECLIGCEAAGRTENGSRVMCIVKNSGIANMVESDRNLSWCIPDEWSFEEAATVPIAYATVYYAMIMVGQIQPGQSILIHSGSGAVGQAAINVALFYGCEVFITVGTSEKRAFIKKLFPQLKDSHIGNSRDTSFEDMIRRNTNGKGVDVVLNSLTGEKLEASIRCLGRRGRFLEIGKFDISNNTSIGMHSHKELSLHGITLDHAMQPNDIKMSLWRLLLSGIESGAVRPLTYTTFEKNGIESAFRYVAAGKHMGKVVVKIRDEKKTNRIEKPCCLPLEAVPRYTCQPDHVYIIVGGLGGLGLELADWFILRGEKILLTSRNGVTNGYQSSRLRVWLSYGADVQISTHDLTTESGCEEMLNMANGMGPVEAIYNLAVVLKDSAFHNQTPDNFSQSFRPKGLVTILLDKLSRKLCPVLKYFVVFSSLSCGHGVAGQTNYAFSNSVMERICENRKKVGLPGLAIQWGAIGEVGLLADVQREDVIIEVGGTKQQKLSTCLSALDNLLKLNAPIVSFMVLAEKKTGESGNRNILDAVAQIIGFKDLQTIPQQVSLSNLGMDSMMAVEIKQCLEKDFEIFLTADAIRTLTFGGLEELASQGNVEKRNEVDEVKDTTPLVQVQSKPVNDKATNGLNIFITKFGEDIFRKESVIYNMPSIVSDANGIERKNELNGMEKIVFIMPGVDGCIEVLEKICKKLNIKVHVIEIEYKNENCEQMVDKLYKLTTSRLVPGSQFWLIGHSSGIFLGKELSSKLENRGFNGTVFSSDGSLDCLFYFASLTINFDNDIKLPNNVICNIIDINAPSNVKNGI